MKQKPLHSALVRQQYDAIVTDLGNGRFNIETLRNEKFKNMLQLLLKNPQAKIPPQKDDRNVGVNVVGFLMIFLGMSAFFYFFPFAEDKEQGQLLRISASPLSFNQYLAAHFLFCLCSFVPPWVALALLQTGGWNIGFSMGQYAGLFLILAILGSSFALLLNTLLKKPDNANMLGSSIMVVTSTLAGCFYSFSKKDAVLDHLIKILPQKQFMDFAINLQNGEALRHMFPVFYILAISLVMFGVAYVKLRHDFVERA
jgi:ABC-2 type transport system permease protein